MQNDRKHLLRGIGILAGLTQVGAVYACDDSNFRWANSSGNLYINGPVTCTLSDIVSINRPEVLELVDPENKVWMLRANLRLEDGARLKLHGDEQDGDVNELRLASPGAFGNISVRADWGSIDIQSTRITSWNEATNLPDGDSSDGRAYIHVRSRLAEDGSAEESRMDIIDSEIRYLGYHAAEAYGIVWKVMNEAFDTVDVYGDIKNSYIHHNYMGMYSYGAYGMEISNNEVAFNESYGIDPHDDSDTLKIIDNFAHDNGSHGIICSRRCDNLTITGNESVRNRHGIMLHRDVTDSLVANNVVTDNRETGIVLFESHNNTIKNNEVLRNQHGIRLSLGSHGNLIENNSVKDNQEYGIYFFKGSDEPETTDGRPSKNIFRKNRVENQETAIKLTDGDENLFVENEFVNSSQYRFKRGNNNELRNNHYEVIPIIHNEGDVEMATRTIVTEENTVVVKMDDFSSASVRNNAHQMYQPDEKILNVTATAEEAFINLDKAVAGPQEQLQAIPLYVKPLNSDVSVSTIDWTTEDQSWEIAAADGNDTVEFRAAGLTPAASYTISKNGSGLFYVTADAEGSIDFQDTPGSSDAITYAVMPYDGSVGLEPYELAPADTTPSNEGSGSPSCSGDSCETGAVTPTSSDGGVSSGGGSLGFMLTLLGAATTLRRKGPGTIPRAIH